MANIVISPEHLALSRVSVSLFHRPSVLQLQLLRSHPGRFSQ